MHFLQQIFSKGKTCKAALQLRHEIEQQQAIFLTSTPIQTEKSNLASEQTFWSGLSKPADRANVSKKKDTKNDKTGCFKFLLDSEYLDILLFNLPRIHAKTTQKWTFSIAHRITPSWIEYQNGYLLAHLIICESIRTNKCFGRFLLSSSPIFRLH